MGLNSGPIRGPNRIKVYEGCKTSFDSIVKAPNLDTIHSILPRPKINYSTVNLLPIADHVMKNLIAKDDLFGSLSEVCLVKLRSSIMGSFSRINTIDLNEGGDGMIDPTFVDIMHEFAIRAQENDFKFLSNDSDKILYAKYFWAFDLKAKLIAEHLFGIKVA